MDVVQDVVGRMAHIAQLGSNTITHVSMLLRNETAADPK